MSERTVGQIDAALTIERAVWIYELRAGHDSTAALDASAHVDALLDERIDAMAVRRLRRVERGAEAGDGVRPHP